MRIRIAAFDAPLTLQFEPSGMEYDLSPGEHMCVAWPPVGDPGAVTGDIEYAPGLVTVSARGTGYVRAWNADGVEVTT
ncbi:hypothetical protein [Streptomyces sp. NPDC048142]|uniref:hypothetical protein n=1 Tax=Streptomyces sp. NPDC048142 TaxID=3365501 RepID=UPI003714BA22